MSDEGQIFTIYIGDDVAQALQVTKNKLPIDLTGAQEISITFKNDPSQAVQTYVATKTGGQISLSNAVQGLINLVLTAAVTALFAPENSTDLDIVVTDSGGKHQTYRVPSSLTVLQRNP